MGATAERGDPVQRIAIVALPGTITSLGYDIPIQYLSAGQLRDRLLKLAPNANVDAYDFSDVPGYALTTRHWVQLLHLVAGLNASYGGIIVAHGTNTLEETAFFLQLTMSTDSVAIVVCGAMRPPVATGADGDQNLLDALRVASTQTARGIGVLVVLNQTIWSATESVKINTYRLDAFDAPDRGPLGYITSHGDVSFHHRPAVAVTTRPWDRLGSHDDLPRVDLVISHVGADGALVDGAVAAGAAGIVSAGSGAGFPTPQEESALNRAREAGVVVCIASRVGAGPVDPFPSLSQHFVLAKSLPAVKARILLSLALTTTKEVRRIQEIFDEYG